MSISAVKTLQADPSSHTWTALENLIKLAAAADIPLVGGAFGVASEVIGAFSGSDETQMSCSLLLQCVASYSDTLWEFIQAMTPHALKHSKEPQAILARQAIDILKETLDKVYAIAKRHSLRGRVKRALRQASVINQLDECRETLQLAQARYQATISSILVAYAVKLSLSDAAVQRLAINSFPFAPHELRILQHIPSQEWDRDDFWVDTFKGSIGEKTTVAKMYYESSGGEKAFLEDVKILGKNLAPRMPRLIGHCHDSVPPYLVFDYSNVMPFKQYLTNFCLSNPPEVAIAKTWTMLIDLKNAVQFFAENNELNYHLMRNAIFDARVDHNGEVMMTPIRDLKKCKMFITDGDVEKGLHLIVKEWVTVFSRRVAFRPLRPLYFAMGRLGNVWEVMNTPKSALKDPFKAAEMLEKWWPTELHEKEYSWPNDHDEGGGPEFGDVGVFEPLHPPKFRKLTNIKKELPTYLFVGNKQTADVYDPKKGPPPWETCTLMAPFSYRRTVYPVQDIDWEKDENHEIGLWAGASIRTKVPGRSVHMFWRLQLHESRYDARLYFARNARNIAAKHGVKPWDLVLVSARQFMMRSTLPPEVVQRLTRPIYAFFYLDEGGPPWQPGFGHWSYSKQGFLPYDDGTTPDFGKAMDVGFDAPKFEIASSHPCGTEYIQFERRDFIECYNHEIDWTFREPENSFKPPPKAKTEDGEGISVPFLGKRYDMYPVKPDGTKDYDRAVVTLIDI